MARPATGSPRWNAGLRQWEARVSVPGAPRMPVPMPEIGPCLHQSPSTHCACANCAQARRVAKIISDRSRREGRVHTSVAETASEWFQRYLNAHEENGCDTRAMTGAWAKYVAPFIGTKPLTSVRREEIVAIRDNLTRARKTGQIGAKRAQNIWGDIVMTPLRRAFTDDDPDYSSVRVGPAAANPALAMKPPVNAEQKEADEKRRQALDPSDFLTLVSCTAIPTMRRRAYAIKAFTGLRPAEVYGLRWADVRLDATRPVIKVGRSTNTRTGEDAPTKTKHGNREVPIHPHLRPLLRAMREAAGNDPTARVIPVTGNLRVETEKGPETLRADLRTAGVSTPELQEGDAVHLPFDDRSWRTTFASWAQSAGFDGDRISAWLGHKPHSVAAAHYLRVTPHFEDVALPPARPGVVAPFPPLPEAVTRFGSGSGPLAQKAGDPSGKRGGSGGNRTPSDGKSLFYGQV